MPVELDNGSADSLSMLANRDWILLAATALLAVTTLLVGTSSLEWIGRTFPGFLILENRVVASAGLTWWPATEGGSIYQLEVTSIDGRDVRHPDEIRRYIESHPVGTEFSYVLERGEARSERTVASREFDAIDYSVLFGSLALNGLVLALTALMIRFLRGHAMVATGAFSTLFISGMWALSACDLYGPYQLFRLHAACETLLFAGVIHWTLVFPQPKELVVRRPRILLIPYAFAAVLTLANQIGLHDPDMYRVTHHLAVLLFGTALVAMITGLLHSYLRPPSFEARQRIKVVTFGSAAALFPPVLISLGASVTSGEVPQNFIAFTAVFFPLSVGWAVVRHNLFDVDVFVRRTLNYGALTTIATFSYVGLVQIVDAIAGAGVASAGSFRIFLPALLLVGVLPLRDRVQRAVDKLFYRSAYDFRKTIESASAKLASFVELEQITSELSDAIGSTLHPGGISLLVRAADADDFSTVSSLDTGPDLDRPTIASLENHKGVRELGDGAIAIPCVLNERLVAVIALHRPQSGAMYSSDDRSLLQTLANQGAVAIQNALAIEAVRDLNRDLEKKVLERTEELRAAQAALVHREKIASLGQFVAGIAHELNNPLNFVQGNIFCLQEYAGITQEALAEYERLARDEAPELSAKLEEIREKFLLDDIVADTDSAFEGCLEGIERSTSLVSDLGQFSRRSEGEFEELDVEEILDAAIRLLRGKLSGIDVVLEYGSVPSIRCMRGQLDQVFVNLISNACDAMNGAGKLCVKTRRPADRSVVVVTISDTGSGISEDDLAKVFDPFFTTKDVGKGTGLGLSISYGIVERHDGRIWAESERGAGTTFVVELPIRSIDTPADDKSDGAEDAET